MKLIACAHPGKIGDALWSLPTVRALCEERDAKCDFFTSDYCRPMKDLIEAQPYINQMIMPAGYEIKGHDCGVQPWQMPIPPEGYGGVYQLGFQGIPSGCIGESIAEKIGLDRAVGRDLRWFNLPPTGLGLSEYVVVTSRGETSYAPLFREFALHCHLPCIEIGAKGQAIGAGVDLTCDSMLRMAALIGGAKVFLGIMSAPLVIANGFPNVKKIVPHDGKSWDMSHVLHTPQHHYVVNPTFKDLLSLI